MIGRRTHWERLGQNVIVDNVRSRRRTGAETVIKSTPDGYTILLISMSTCSTRSTRRR
jgi:tripartite-type tricarboxylate transporter receptor subunit TctC